MKAGATLKSGTMSQMTIWGRSFLKIVLSSGILDTRFGFATGSVIVFPSSAAQIIPQVSDIACTCWR